MHILQISAMNAGKIWTRISSFLGGSGGGGWVLLLLT